MKRKIKASVIEAAVRALFIKANTVLRPDVFSALEEAFNKEKRGTASAEMLAVLMNNADIAREELIPICQDTGLATVFVEIGKDADISGVDVPGGIDRGVAKAYIEGNLRRSVVKDPFLRENTGDNTPAVVHIEIVKGNRVTIHVLPKGFGSENKGRVAMLNPTAGPDAVVDFCVETVKAAGPDACPPYVLGVGCGGTLENAAFLAKKALLRPINEHNSKGHLARIESEILKKCNKLGIGVMGLGGRTTVLGVNVEAAPTHIAGLPVAVSISCHALRSASAVI
jgi:fumarate hydratase subunit alpha